MEIDLKRWHFINEFVKTDINNSLIIDPPYINTITTPNSEETKKTDLFNLTDAEFEKEVDEMFEKNE